MPRQALDYIAPGDTLPVGAQKIDENFIELYNSRRAIGVDVASFATTGDGSIGTPWKGWETAIAWSKFTRYNFRSGHYEYPVSPNYLDDGAGGWNPGIELIGEPGTYLHHAPMLADGLCDAFIMDAGPTIFSNWIQNMRVENLIVAGATETLTGVTYTVGVNTISKTGAMNAVIVNGCAVTLDAGTAKARSYIVSSHTNDTVTLDRVVELVTGMAASGAATLAVCRTRDGFFFRGCRDGVFDRLSARDVSEAGIRTAACVANCMRLPRVTHQEPYASLDVDNYEPFMCRPHHGIVLEGRDGGDHSTNWFIEMPVIEGPWGNGIWLTSFCFANYVINGLCATAAGIGVGMKIDGHRNSIVRIDSEQNGGIDYLVSGESNIFDGCYGGYFQILPESGRTGDDNVIINLSADTLDIDADCVGIVVIGTADIVHLLDRPTDINIFGSSTRRLITDRLRLVNSTLDYDSATPEIDFDTNSLQTLEMEGGAGDVTFSTANVAANKSKTVLIIGDPVGIKNLFWPSGWHWMGADGAPSTLAVGKWARLTLESYGTSNNEIAAAYVVDASPAADILTGLEMWLKLDEPSGSAAADSSGNGNDATLTGSASFVAGHINNGVLFNTTDNGIVIDAPITTGTTYSISMWVKPDASVNSYGILMTNGASSAGLFFLGSGAGGDALKLNLYYGADHLSSGVLTDGVWNHVVLVVDGGSATFYIDKVASGTADSATSFDAEKIGQTSASTNYIDAIVDDIRLYSIALDTDQIAALFDYTE